MLWFSISDGARIIISFPSAPRRLSPATLLFPITAPPPRHARRIIPCHTAEWHCISSFIFSVRTLMVFSHRIFHETDFRGFSHASPLKLVCAWPYHAISFGISRAWPAPPLPMESFTLRHSASLKLFIAGDVDTYSNLFLFTDDVDARCAMRRRTYIHYEIFRGFYRWFISIITAMKFRFRPIQFLDGFTLSRARRRAYFSLYSARAAW